jgi:uncharacterized protein (UPF0147 family)
VSHLGEETAPNLSGPLARPHVTLNNHRISRRPTLLKSILSNRKSINRKMKFAVALASLFICTEAFAPASRPATVVSKLNQVSDDMGLPCIEECAIDSYPNMPESVHPGVVTGQAMLDLLDHAKENGKILELIYELSWAAAWMGCCFILWQED